MWFEYIKIARRALLGQRFRSALTVLSITIGAFAIVWMTSLAQSGLSSLMRSVEELGGARVVMITSQRPKRAENRRANYTRGLTLEDREFLLTKLPYVQQTTMFASLDRQDVLGDTGISARTDFVAATSDFLTGLNLHLADGRMFTEEEAAKRARLCVVGHKTAEKLWDGHAIGHSLSIAGLRCRVIGQLANEDRWGEHWGFDWLDYVIAPRAAVIDMKRQEVESSSLIMLRTDRVEHNEIVKRITNALLVERHHGVDDFMIWDFHRLMAKFQSMFAIMEAIVGMIAGIALLVGGIGIMNMMLVSVAERVREIGIRKAIGASPRAISAQFLCEAVVLSGVGGTIGVALGIVMALVSSAVIRHFKPSWVSIISHSAVLVALSVSLLIGVVFGYFPARRAGRMDAILAMRR